MSASTSQQPRLNWDVLAEVMSWLGRQSTLRMSCLCRDLRLIAPKYLLRGEVDLDQFENFMSLSEFMFADPRGRFPFLYRLSLRFRYIQTSPGEDVKVARLVSKFFELATELKILKIHDCNLLEIHESLLTSFPPLTNLRRLHLIIVSRNTYEVMKHIQAPLSVLEAHHWELPVDHLSDFPLFRDSLQTLDMTGVQLSSCKFQYPLVAALRVSGCEYAELRVFERCFPGLRDLSFETTMDEVVLGDDQPLDKVEDIRRFNLETSARDSWTSLRRVTSSINSLYALGIKCHAESLHLLHDTVNAADLCQKLQTILLDLRPTCLEVSLEIPDLSFLQLVAAMAPVARTLTRLKLHIDMHGHYFRDPSPKLRAQLIESLSTFPLQFLWLDLSWREVADHIPVPNEEDEGEGDDASPGPPTPAKPFTTLDRMALAEHASRALPALKHVCISTELLFQPVFETKMFFEVQHGEAGTKNTPRTITQLPWDARAKELRDSPPCHQVSDTDGYCIHCLYQRRSSRVNFLD